MEQVAEHKGIFFLCSGDHGYRKFKRVMIEQWKHNVNSTDLINKDGAMDTRTSSNLSA